MKTVAIVLNSAWPAYNFRMNLARALKNDGYKVCFIAQRDEEKYCTLIEKEFTFYTLDIDVKGINPFSDLKTLISLYKLYKQIKPDVVLNFTIKLNIYSSIVARTLGIKAISNITGLGTIFIEQSFLTQIAKVLYRFALKHNYKVFFQNKDDMNLFLDNNLVLKEIVDLLPGSGVDLAKFVPVVRKKNDKFIFLLIARLLRDKGIVEFIEAIKIIKKKYKNIEFQILGAVGVENKTAITKEELDIWIDDGLVNYLGTSDNVQELIANSDCVVLPSYREGTPRSLLEAGAMEKPVIATNVVGCKEVVDDGINGYLCIVKDSKDLANNLELMLNLPNKQRILMGKAGRKKILTQFDEKIVLNKYLNIIKGINV